MEIKIVLCPIDFSDISGHEIDLALRVCETFGARLVLHHNLSAIAPGFSKAWEWDQEHRRNEQSEAEAHRRMQKLLNGLPASVRAEASISHGPLATVVLTMARELPADLMILGSHGWSTEDHASVTERIVDQSPCSVLTIQEKEPAPALRWPAGREPMNVLAATDLSESGNHAVAFAVGLARKLSLDLHLLHVTAAAKQEAARRALLDLVPFALRDRVRPHVRGGRAEEEIQKAIGEIDPAFVVMGTRTRGFFRRLSPHSTAHEMLHRSPRPVWFVPPATPA
jgi:nucleotide-binding universal stress UspA family protein